MNYKVAYNNISGILYFNPNYTIGVNFPPSEYLSFFPPPSLPPCCDILKCHIHNLTHPRGVPWGLYAQTRQNGSYHFNILSIISS